MRITHPKDFYAGLLFFLFGSAALLIAFQYPLGSAARMGPGYFPRVLGGIMMTLGAILAVRSFALKGDPIAPFAWKAIGLVLGGVAVFGAIEADHSPRIALPCVDARSRTFAFLRPLADR